MNSEEHNGNDPKLRGVLSAWRVTAPLPPRFREQVWRRIARAEAQAPYPIWVRMGDWIMRALARPALAVSYVVVLLLVGLAAGYRQAHAENARAGQEFGARYVQMIDPYQMPRQ